MKVIFLGTPEFAIKSLQKLIDSKHEVIAVITQPDKPAKRGEKLQPSAVKEYAIKCGLPVYTFDKVSRDGVDTISSLKPDIMVTCAYGQLLSKALINLPKYGIVNVHASLLPKYRGASPIQTAIINGDEKTGVTIMRTDEGLDTGDIINYQTTNILPSETAGELSCRLADIGANLLLETLDQIENGTARYIKQFSTGATLTKKINKYDCTINWNKSSRQIKNLVLGANPQPIASTIINGTIIKVYRAKEAEIDVDKQYKIGEVLPCSNAKTGIFVQCGYGVLQILEAQFPSGKVLDGKQIINGRKISVGDVFDTYIQIGE